MGATRTQTILPDAWPGGTWRHGSKAADELLSFAASKPQVARESAVSPGASAYSFGPFRLFPGQRLLLEGDNPIRLGSRALDILVALIERAGHLVGKEELIARVWPNLFVEESNLKIQVSALRRALGDGQAGNRYIANVPGRGYEFVAPVGVTKAPPINTVPDFTKGAVHNLPVALTRIIGREETVAALVSRLARDRAVTVVGPGGIGKTAVALAVAEAVVSGYEDGVWLVDLAPLGDPRLVPSAVATVLGLEIPAEDTLPGLIANLRDKRMLLVLDNCEHVIEAAASLATALLRGVAGMSILATSREPLGVEGEREYRLRPWVSPPAAPRCTAAEAMAFPAVQLLVERASAVVEDFVLSDANAPLAIEICRKLDGLPLAIEFAAARVEVLGIRGLAAHLSDGLELLGPRRRAATPWHGSMRTALDGSYRLLSEDERQFFRRLGIFVGSFTAEAAAAVADDTPRARAASLDMLADLVTKSLVVADVSGPDPRFRLLETTRAYALERLTESGEREQLARRHAEYGRDLLERAETVFARRQSVEQLADYEGQIGNLRSALDWAFSPDGDAAIGVALTVAAVPLWMHLSLLDECRTRVEQALAAVAAGPTPDLRSEMKLHAALGASLRYTRGATAEMGAACTSALEAAESLDDAAYQLRALSGLWIFHTANDGHPTALSLAQQFCTVAARSDANERLVGERLIGTSQHFLGHQESARGHLERVLAESPVRDSRSQIAPFQYDLRVTANALLARTLWLQGFPEQATRAAETSVADAQTINHAMSLCYALVHAACPIALWVGDTDAAEHYVEMLVHHSTKHALALWHTFARSYQGALEVKRGDLAIGLRSLRAGFDELSKARSALRLGTFLGELTEALGRAGQVSEALSVVNEAIARSEHSEERWWMAELLRIRGELLLLQGDPAAEADFRQAIDWARRQDALSWELRTATSLARLLDEQDRSRHGLAVLRPVYDRFTEGFGTADLIAAKRLLDRLNDAARE